MRKLLSIIFATSSFLAWAGDVTVSSPDNRLQVKVSDAGGRLYYTATLDGQEVLQPSALGLKTSLGDLTKGLSIVDTKTSVIDEHYTMRGTKASSADYKANALTLDLKNQDGRVFSILFQVSDRDIAFRYEIPRQKIGHSEVKRARILSASQYGHGYIFPALFHLTLGTDPSVSSEADYRGSVPGVRSEAWILLSETGVGSNYCGSHLSDYQAGMG